MHAHVCTSQLILQLWDSSTGTVLADFKGHKNTVTCCALSSSGKLVVSSSEDKTIKVLHVHVRVTQLRIKSHLLSVGNIYTITSNLEYNVWSNFVYHAYACMLLNCLGTHQYKDLH